MIRLLHSIASHPWVYNQIQELAGIERIKRRFSQHIQSIPVPKTLVDLGGGTGIYRNLWPDTTHYLCCDVDVLKLQGFKKQHPDTPVVADASQVPLRSGCADVVMCTAVVHHLTEAQFDRVLAESRRLLVPGGVLIIIDPLWVTQNWIGRFIWSIDRGDSPRTEQALRESLSRHFKIVHWDRFTLFHDYVIAVSVVA